MVPGSNSTVQSSNSPRKRSGSVSSTCSAPSTHRLRGERRAGRRRLGRVPGGPRPRPPSCSPDGQRAPAAEQPHLLRREGASSSYLRARGAGRVSRRRGRRPGAGMGRGVPLQPAPPGPAQALTRSALAISSMSDSVLYCTPRSCPSHLRGQACRWEPGPAPQCPAAPAGPTPLRFPATLPGVQLLRSLHHLHLHLLERVRVRTEASGRRPGGGLGDLPPQVWGRRGGRHRGVRVGPHLQDYGLLLEYGPGLSCLQRALGVDTWVRLRGDTPFPTHTRKPTLQQNPLLPSPAAVSPPARRTWSPPAPVHS